MENLGIGAPLSKAAIAKVGADLLALHAEYQFHLKQTNGQGAAALAFQSRNSIAPIAGGSVVIDTAASRDPEALAAELRALGAEKVTVFGRTVSARLPIASIPGLKSLSSLQFARPAYAVTHVGNVTSQGDAAMRADIGRTAFGVDGTGVMVGTLSDSYDCLGGAATAATTIGGHGVTVCRRPSSGPSATTRSSAPRATMSSMDGAVTTSSVVSGAETSSAAARVTIGYSATKARTSCSVGLGTMS